MVDYEIGDNILLQLDGEIAEGVIVTISISSGYYSFGLPSNYIEYGVKINNVIKYVTEAQIRGRKPRLLSIGSCECGSGKVSSAFHSSWCPKYEKK